VADKYNKFQKRQIVLAWLMGIFIGFAWQVPSHPKNSSWIWTSLAKSILVSPVPCAFVLILFPILGIFLGYLRSFFTGK